jgi:hypothetical protein
MKRRTSHQFARVVFAGMLFATLSLRAEPDLLALYPCQDLYTNSGIFTSETGGRAAWDGAQMIQDAGVSMLVLTNDPVRGMVLEMTVNWASMRIGPASYDFSYKYDPLSYGSNAFTMMLWYKAPENQVLDFSPLLFKRGASFANDNYWQFSVWDYFRGTGNGRLRVEDANQAVDSFGSVGVFNNWVHYAASMEMDSSTPYPQSQNFMVYVNLYKNGHLLPLNGSNFIDLNWTGYGWPIWVGNVHSATHNRSVPGARFSDIRFYNGVLTPYQIRTEARIIDTWFEIQDGMAKVNWESVIGKTYQLKKSTNLSTQAWSNVGDPITASVTNLFVNDVIGAGSAFYKVTVVP